MTLQPPLQTGADFGRDEREDHSGALGELVPLVLTELGSIFQAIEWLYNEPFYLLGLIALVTNTQTF